MADYHLWHPAYIPAPHPTLEAFLTLGESSFLSRGTDELVRRALAALGVTTAPAAWELQVMRTHYFSSYRGVTGDWEDDWALVWQLRAIFPEGAAPTLPRPPAWGYFDVDAVDRTFDPFDPPAQWMEWPVLILADMQELGELDGLQQIVVRQFPEAECRLGEAFSRDPQLRCNLGGRSRSFFESGAGEVEALLKQLVDAGAFVRFDHAPEDPDRS